MGENERAPPLAGPANAGEKIMKLGKTEKVTQASCLQGSSFAPLAGPANAGEKRGQPVEAVRAVRIVRCCPWFLVAGEERMGRIWRMRRMGNKKP